MPSRRLLLFQLIGSALIVVLTAGCFQAVGTDFQATDAANAQPTWTLIPTNTPFPTEPLPTTTPEPTQSQILDLAFAPTTDPLALLTPEELPLNAQVVQAATIDPILLTVTAIYANGNAQLQAFETPTLAAPVQPLDGIAMTATHIVEQATQVVGATLTQAAINAGAVPIGPTADPNVVVATQAPLVAGADCIHEVRATDRNLYRIAQNYGLTVQEIAQASGILNPDLIFVGQQLTIPGCGVTGAVPLPTSTPTTGAVVSGSAQTGSNPVIGVTFTPIPDGQSLSATTAGRTHMVRQGETLFQISLQYGTTVHAIAAANGLSNINMIYIGQDLVIP